MPFFLRPTGAALHRIFSHIADHLVQPLVQPLYQRGLPFALPPALPQEPPLPAPAPCILQVRAAAIDFAGSQVDYMLGSSGRSFVVGWGTNPPLRVSAVAARPPTRPDSAWPGAGWPAAVFAWPLGCFSSSRGLALRRSSWRASTVPGPARTPLRPACAPAASTC